MSRASTALFASLLPPKKVQLIPTSNAFPKAFSGLAGAVNKPFPTFPSELAHGKGGNMESRKNEAISDISSRAPYVLTLCIWKALDSSWKGMTGEVFDGSHMK